MNRSSFYPHSFRRLTFESVVDMWLAGESDERCLPRRHLQNLMSRLYLCLCRAIGLTYARMGQNRRRKTNNTCTYSRAVHRPEHTDFSLLILDLFASTYTAERTSACGAEERGFVSSRYLIDTPRQERHAKRVQEWARNEGEPAQKSFSADARRRFSGYVTAGRRPRKSLNEHRGRITRFHDASLTKRKADH